LPARPALQDKAAGPVRHPVGGPACHLPAVWQAGPAGGRFHLFLL